MFEHHLKRKKDVELKNTRRPDLSSRDFTGLTQTNHWPQVFFPLSISSPVFNTSFAQVAFKKKSA